jgi:hypothetical protein
VLAAAFVMNRDTLRRIQRAYYIRCIKQPAANAYQNSTYLRRIQRA